MIHLLCLSNMHSLILASANGVASVSEHVSHFVKYVTSVAYESWLEAVIHRVAESVAWLGGWWEECGPFRRQGDGCVRPQWQTGLRCWLWTHEGAGPLGPLTTRNNIYGRSYRGPWNLYCCKKIHGMVFVCVSWHHAGWIGEVLSAVMSSVI